MDGEETPVVAAGRGDRVFVPAAFMARLARRPAVTSPPTVRAAWLTVQLADLTAPAMVATRHGVAALRLATQIHHELSALAG